eukprot:CAMPEP_0196766534 /NCGR_PEP_ID=MMETSP1095-20130614/26012_1 /TAXON_ID=96789 ORGANISM="Chromulina nebulosa, Strain UTEXLB2642" /NCGR_SAMPLE_ID=MMETSP1095 /ASSEMBLY_ACC=CAM_ASM_000446 /LENGTH=568 /DNA_ID=CAMNT_0042129021 /DNA_START=61 /DNA_END=1764 /DNA_ORIENTATION=+
MGGGASSIQGIEDLLTTTYMIGKAIAAVTFPGMYRIYDFHSNKAPKLKNIQKKFIFFQNDDDDEDDDDYDDSEPPDPSHYAHFFHVKVGDDIIYIEDPIIENEAGWTPLHSCCMSFNTIPAGLALIDETLRLNGDLNIKTKSGPGSFNSGWTPLQMACAYGVEPIVEKLVKSGADLNATNSYGYSPLIEACHRGFLNIVLHLIKGRINLDYLPPYDLAQSSPFIGAPPHTALGETARAGFHKIVQVLIDSGADKDKPNALGWTPLHEACFYNRIETVKTLLLAGANPCHRTRIGALPYHLTGFQVLRSMLSDIGGPKAVPKEGDNVDMVHILRELTMAETAMIADSEGHIQIIKLSDTSDDNESQQKEETHALESSSKPESKHSVTSKPIIDIPENKESNYIHSGAILGNLPALGSPKTSPNKTLHNELDSILDDRSSPLKKISMLADDKTIKKKKKNKKDEIPKDIPVEYLCQLTKRPMTEPVKTTYGNIYEKTAILGWLNQQGHICPLTGAPLAETDLKPMNELAEEIKQWILKRSMKQSNQDDNVNTKPETKVTNNNNQNATEDD